MNIPFSTIGRMGSIEDRGIYPDLLRTFRDHGHTVYTVSPYEKRTGKRRSWQKKWCAYAAYCYG